MPQSFFRTGFRFILGLGFGAALWLSAASLPAQDAQPKPPELSVKLGKIPKLVLTPRPPVTAEQAKKIKELISALAKLDSPDFGLSPTFRGNSFAPVPGQEHFGGMILTNHGVKPSETVKALVTLGPDALPFLLDALDDKTPTKLTIKYEAELGGLGGMYPYSGLDSNPVNPLEQTVLQAQAKAADEWGEHVKSYAVKVGDVCFVAIGQIVGRDYHAVSYAGFKSVFLRCTSQDQKLCATVRAIWKAKDPWKRMLDSLCMDYATEAAVFNGETKDGWEASDRQCAAALRLLFYFDKEAAPLIADRLAKLNVGNDKDIHAYLKRCVANGVRSRELIKAAAWSKNPLVRNALTAVFKRADALDDLLAALPAVDDKELIRGRLETLIAALPPTEFGPCKDGYHLLIALGKHAPKTAKIAFQNYLKTGNLQRAQTMCYDLQEVKLQWDTEILGSLLDDKRSWSDTHTYAIFPGEDDPRLPVRICDEAALTLSKNHPEFKFTLAGSHATLNKQIYVIQSQLEKNK